MRHGIELRSVIQPGYLGEPAREAAEVSALGVSGNAGIALSNTALAVYNVTAWLLLVLIVI
jgi:hypothetical protein